MQQKVGISVVLVNMPQKVGINVILANMQRKVDILSVILARNSLFSSQLVPYVCILCELCVHYVCTMYARVRSTSS